MATLRFVFSTFLIVLLFGGCSRETTVSSDLPEQNESITGIDIQDGALARSVVSRADLMVFQPAGDYGGGVLVPGTIYPPTDGGYSKLRRKDNYVTYRLLTSGLPPGAYTNWFVAINNPENCTDGDCDDFDVFFNPATNASVFWADGGIVGADGIGDFRSRIDVGVLPDGPDQIGLPGPGGLTNPMGAEIHIIVKYHGPVSSDPHDRYLQTHTLTGLCGQGANAYDLSAIGFGIQCFDPQFVIHKP